MAKKGISLPTAYQHPSTGMKPPRNSAALWFCLCLLVVFATLIAGCTTDTRGRPGPAGAPGFNGTPGAPGGGNMTMNMTANMSAGPPGLDNMTAGPQGIQGIQGVQGVQGAAGATGPMGPENLTAINDSYYLRDTSLTMTGQNIYRNTTFSNLNLYGGDVAAGQGGIVSVEGSDSGSADSIVFYSPDPGHSANLIAMAVNSLTTGIPYLTMKAHQIKYLDDPSDPQDATTLAYEDARPVVNSSYQTAADLIPYYKNDTSKALTGGSIHRDVNDEYIHIQGGHPAENKSGSIIFYGGDNVAQSGGIIASVGNASGYASEVIWSVLGRTDTPELSLNDNKIVSLKDPTNAQDAVTKKYVDDVNATGVTDHGALTGLADDDHLQYANLSGRADGQILNGGTGNNENLTLNATSGGIGDVKINPNGGTVSIGVTGVAQTLLHLKGNPVEILFNSTSVLNQWHIGVIPNTGAGPGGFAIVETNVARRFYIQNKTGNVGIYTATPPNKLTVVGDASVSTNLGIATTTPQRPLEVVTTSSIPGIRLRAADSDPTGTTPYIEFGYGNTTSAWARKAYAGLAGGGNPTFWIVTSDGGSLANITFLTSAFSLGTTKPTKQLHTTGEVRFANYGAGAATFDADGVITSVSDEKVKTAIQPFTAGLNQIMNIHPIKFHYTSESGLDAAHTYSGFSAQDVQKAIPEIVYSKEDIKYETVDNKTVEIPLGTNTLSVYDRGLMAAMVNAIKEQQVIINDQQGQIDNLTKRVEALEKKVGI